MPVVNVSFSMPVINVSFIKSRCGSKSNTIYTFTIYLGTWTLDM